MGKRDHARFLCTNTNRAGNESMKGSEFLRKLKKLGSENGTKVELNERRGKGGHVTLCYGMGTNKPLFPT